MVLPKSNNNSVSNFMKIEPNLFNLLKGGDLVEGKILEKNSRMITVDLGKYGTGVVYRAEMQNAKNMVKDLKIGDIIHGKAVKIDNEDGLVELSLAAADKQKAWIEVGEIAEKEEILKIKPVAFNRGGLLAEINGLQAFLPISQLSNEHYPKTESDNKAQIAGALENLVGQEISIKIIDLNPRTNKFIISEKAVAEETNKEFAKNYTVGQIIEGIISGVADFGAFVKFTDNPNVEGLIHVSELDWRIIENPKEIVKVDDVVKAKIIEIKDGKIFLSLKALKADPWDNVSGLYKEGMETKGKVYGFHPFGAIINLQNGLQGQLHVAEFGSVHEMKKQLPLEKDHIFIIESIKPEDRRITLKLKA